MAWCFSTRASVATVLTTHPCVSRCLGVNRKLYIIIEENVFEIVRKLVAILSQPQCVIDSFYHTLQTRDMYTLCFCHIGFCLYLYECIQNGLLISGILMITCYQIFQWFQILYLATSTWRVKSDWQTQYDSDPYILTWMNFYPSMDK